jgi:L-aminopeptidase/D-esterase-like protein
MRGVTVIVPGEEGGTCGVEVRGSNPGTLGTTTYDPVNIGEECDAIVLTGGSLWGLATVPGVMEYLFERGKGVRTRAAILPVVPAAVIFDLPVGDPGIRPQKEWGYQAAQAARSGPVAQGNVGAGAGGTIGKQRDGIRLKGGLGTASAALPDGIVVGALVVLNAVGDVVNPATGEFYAVGGGFERVPYRHAHTIGGPPSPEPRTGENTTLVVIATNARLEKTQLTKIAQFAHDGLARAIRPIHSMLDGDTAFVVSVGWEDRIPVRAAYPGEAVDRIGTVAGDLVVRAVLKGTLAAEGIPGWPSYRDWKKARAETPARP